MTEALALYKEARAPRNYKREYAQYHSKQEQIDRRSTRNKARRKLGLKKGDPREVDHKIPLSKGGGNGKGNLRAVSLQANRRKFTKTAFDSDALTAKLLNFFASKGVKTKEDRPLTKAEQRFFNKRFKGKKTERRFTKTANDRERTYAEMRDAIRGFSAKQKIDPEKAMLVAGGAGYMHGMRDEVNDLDFFHDDLPDFVQEPYGRFDMDGGPGKDLPEAAKQYQMMHGMRVQTPESMLAFYQRLNRPKDQEKIKMLKEHLKMASDHHHIITGHSGAGKSTLARKLSEETGAPIVALDDAPSIRAILQEQKDMARAHPEGKLNLTPELNKKYEAIELKAIQDAIAAKNPSIIEGSYFLKHKPEMFKGHKMMLVDRDRDTILNQRVERQRLKDLGRGREWSDERAKGVRTRGGQLLDYYQPGVDTWRGSSLVEKRAATLYHGSPYEGLTSLQPKEPRGNTDYERQKAVFMTDNPDAAALYALARDKERKNRGWAAIGGRLQLGPNAKLNEKGYIYNVDTDDYLSPPKGEESRGFAIPREIGVSGVKEVTPAEYEHLIDRFDTKDAFRDHVNSLIEGKARE